MENQIITPAPEGRLEAAEKYAETLRQNGCGLTDLSVADFCAGADWQKERQQELFKRLEKVNRGLYNSCLEMKAEIAQLAYFSEKGQRNMLSQMIARAEQAMVLFEEGGKQNV